MTTEGTGQELLAAVARLEDYVRRALDEQQRARERLDATGQRLERLLAQVLQTEVARMREELQTLRETLRSSPAAAGRERSLHEAVEAAGAAAREALERLQLLDATQATSLHVVSDELRALREEIHKWPGARGHTGAEERTDAMAAAGAGHAGGAAVQPLVDIVRMHMELLRLLVERSTLAPRAAAGAPGDGKRAAEVGPPGGGVAEEDKAGEAKWLRAELRSHLAAVEHQLHEVREQQERRSQALERRLEDVHHVVDHLAAQEPSRRWLTIVATGLLFVVAVALGGLLWHRWSSTVPPGEKVVRSEGPAASDYARWLREAEAALGRGDWDRAERYLQEALRIRPDSVEVALARAAVAARRGAASAPATPAGAAAVGEQPEGKGMSCTIRDGKLCCSVGPNAEQCVAWPTAAALPLGSVVPTPKPRSRSARAVPSEAPPPDLEDEMF